MNSGSTGSRCPMPLGRSRDPSPHSRPRSANVAGSVGLLLTLIGLSSTCAAAADYLGWVPKSYRDAIQCSDVIFMKPGTIEQYRAFRADREAWGYRGAFPHKLLGTTTSLNPKHIKNAQALGMKYVGSITANLWGTLEQRPRNIRLAGETFSGEPLPRRAPEQKKPRAKRALMGCINIPERREAFIGGISYWLIKLGTDGMQYDDWHQILDAVDLGGCFCPHCMRGFRDYLGRRLSRAELTEAGIDKLGSFDYRTYLKARADVADDHDFLERKDSLPLIRLFRDFQYQCVLDFYREVAEAIRRTGRPGSVMTTNNGLRGAYWIGMANVCDYLACEVHYGSRYRRLDERLAYPFKAADGLGMHIAANPWMQDWGYLVPNPRPQMVRSWIAVTYALGHNMMVPHFQSALLRSKPRGPFELVWYQMEDEETVDVYNFIKDHKYLFDGYRSLAQVAVVYGAGDPSPHRMDVLSRGMFLANYPFVVFVSGTEAIRLRLNPSQLAGLDAVVLTCPMDDLNEEDQAVLKGLAGTVKVARRVDELPAPVVRTRPDNIIVSLRGRPAQRDTYICHVLNWHYDFDTDRTTPQDAEVTIAARAFAPGRVKAAIAYAPGREPQPIAFTQDRSAIRFRVPNLEMWAVLRIETTGTHGGR